MGTKISAFTDGSTAAATDRIAAVRSPFGATDNRYVTPAYIKDYIGYLIGPHLTRVTTDVYIVPPNTASYGTTAMAANVLYALPIFVGKGGTVTKIGCEVTTGAAGNARLGIYNHDATRLLPGTLLLDAGTVDVSSNAVKEITISQAVTDLTRYWLVWVCDVTPTMRSITATASIFGGPSSTSIAGRLSRAFSYAALPADESAQTYSMASANSPLLWLRG